MSHDHMMDSLPYDFERRKGPMTTPRPMTMREKIEKAVLFISDLSIEELEHQSVGTAAEVSLRHINRKATELLQMLPELDAALVKAEEIGEPPAGSHPDEAKPRAETWHKERLNWIDEMERTRAASATNAARLKECEGLLREWWDYHFNRTIGGWDVEFAEKVRKALGISPIIVANEFPASLLAPPSPPNADGAKGGGR